MSAFADKLMNIRGEKRDAAQPSFSAVFGTTRSGITPANPSLTQFRVGMWPAISRHDPVMAMGLMTVLAYLLEHWQQITVYRLFVKIDEGSPNTSWDISQSQFEIEDWHPENLDDNVGLWGNLAQNGDTWTFTLALESDLSTDDDTLTISKTVESVSDLVNWLPEAARELVMGLGLEISDDSPFTLYDTVSNRNTQQLQTLLADLFNWELVLLFALVEGRGGIQDAYSQLVNESRFEDDFGIWSISEAVARTMLPGYAAIESELPPIDEILELFNYHPSASSVLGRALYGSGQTQKAVELLENTVAAYPENVSCWLLLAELYRRSGDFVNTVDTYQRAIELEATSVSLYLNYGQLLPLIESTGYVVEEFILIDPDERSEDYMTWEAVEAYSEAFKLTTTNPARILTSLVLLLIDAADTEADFGRLWQTFRALVSYDGEGDYVRQVVEGFYNLEDIDPALDILEEAIEQNPQRTDLRVNLAAAYLAGDQADAALEQLEDAYELTSDQQTRGEIEHLMLIAEYSDFEIKMGEISDRVNAGSIPMLEELEFLEAVNERAPQYLDPYLLLARTYLLRQEIGTALETLLDAQKRFPADPDIVDTLAGVLWDSGEYQSALSYLEQGLKVNPLHVPLLARMGQSMFDEGNEDDARLYLSRAESLSSQHPALLRVRNYIAHVLAERD